LSELPRFLGDIFGEGSLSFSDHVRSQHCKRYAFHQPDQRPNHCDLQRPVVLCDADAGTDFDAKTDRYTYTDTGPDFDSGTYAGTYADPGTEYRRNPVQYLLQQLSRPPGHLFKAGSNSYSDPDCD
jgi:hypothetical protein